MPEHSCEREPEILDILGAGIARDAWNADLREHAEACAGCAELAEVAGALLDDRRELVRRARVPQSGAMWFRMSVRSRQDAARAAARAGWTLHALLLVLALGVAFALVGPRLVSFGVRFAALPLSATLPLTAIAALLILVPVAVYFAVTEG